MNHRERPGRVGASFFWTVLTLILLGGLALARAATGNLEINGSWPGYRRGAAVKSALWKHYLHVVVEGAGLYVLDVADPHHPQRVGAYTANWSIATCLTISGTHLYAGTREDEGLVILDIADPVHPVRIGAYTQMRSIDDVAVDGDLAFITGDGVHVLDVSDPTKPKRLANFSPAISAWRIVVSDHFAYLAGLGLQVVDVSDPVNPKGIGLYGTTNLSCRGIALAGDYVYLAVAASDPSNPEGVWDGLHVVDVSDRTRPRLVARYHTADVAEDVAVATPFVLLAWGPAFEVLDVSDLAEIKSVGSYTSKSDYICWDLKVGGTTAYAAEYDALEAVDLTNPRAPHRISAYVTFGNATGVALAKNYAYLADWSRGLVQVLNLSDPSHPQQVGSCSTGGHARDLVISANFAYIADGLQHGLAVVDISDSVNPKLVGTYRTPGDAEGIAIQGNYVYVADWHAGLQIFDVSDPVVPQLVGEYKTSGGPNGVALDGRRAYLAAQDSGLLAIDISNPADPRLVGQLDTRGGALKVAISGHYAYVARADWASNLGEGLVIVDISDPTNLKRVSGYGGGRRGLFSVAVAGRYAYVGGWEVGLQMLDISDPVKPMLVAANAAIQPNSTIVSENNLYAAALTDGLLILRVPPSSPFLERYPRFSPVGFEIGVSAPAGQTVQLQRSVDLNSWQDWNVLTGTDVTQKLIDASAPSVPRGFYRIKSP